MRHRRRDTIRRIAVALTITAAGSAGLATAAALKLWECNWCHQQYQGDRPPPFAKCPAKDMKQNHWWVEKSGR